MLRAIAFALLTLCAAPAFAQDWSPSAAQAQQARATAESYWTAGDRGDAHAAYTTLGPGFAALTSEQELTANLARFMTLAGPLIERRIARTTWYKDPPAGVGPGAYAAFDIVARYQNIDRYCGFIVVYQRDETGPFVVLRVEQNYIDNATARQIAQEGGALDEMWRALAHTSCPGWEPSWAIPIPPPPPPAT